MEGGRISIQDTLKSGNGKAPHFHFHLNISFPGGKKEGNLPRRLPRRWPLVRCCCLGWQWLRQCSRPCYPGGSVINFFLLRYWQFGQECFPLTKLFGSLDKYSLVSQDDVPLRRAYQRCSNRISISLKSLAGEKHSSLSARSMNNEQKSFISLSPGCPWRPAWRHTFLSSNWWRYILPNWESPKRPVINYYFNKNIFCEYIGKGNIIIIVKIGNVERKESKRML